MITFVDTGIITPNFLREFYHRKLNRKIRGDRLSPNRWLTNSEPDLDLMFNLTNALKLYLKDIFDMHVTEGVLAQASDFLDMLQDTIEQRCNEYLLKGPDNEDSAQLDHYAARRLADYLVLIENIRKCAYPKRYGEPQDDTYKHLKEFAHRLCVDFLHDHKSGNEEDEVDLQIVASALYESIVKQKKVRVMTTDRDIHNRVGSTYQIWTRYPEFIQGNEVFEPFMENCPDVYSCRDFRRKNANVQDVGLGIVYGTLGYTKKHPELEQFLQETVKKVSESMK